MALWKFDIAQMPLYGLKLDPRGQHLLCRY